MSSPADNLDPNTSLTPASPPPAGFDSSGMPYSAKGEKYLRPFSLRAKSLSHSTAFTEYGEMYDRLTDILDKRLLTALFQPIINMNNGKIVGYEGLIRGPSDCPLHSPVNLLRAAELHDLSVAIEHLCRQVVLESFARLNLEGKLFLNVSPESLVRRHVRHGETLSYIQQLGIPPDRVIIDLTENQPFYDYGVLREAAKHYQDMGFKIAIDDLAEGFSSLRLWSELRPSFVKIDMHFVQGIQNDSLKQQFIRSIQSIATESGCQVIAEGIETDAEFLKIRELGISMGQGYFISRPQMNPVRALPDEVVATLEKGEKAAASSASFGHKNILSVNLLRSVPPVAPHTSVGHVYEIFLRNSDVQTLPVVNNSKPIGMVNRYKLLEKLARPFALELNSKKHCADFMDADPLVVDKGISIQELSHIIAHIDPRHFSNGFIVTEDDHYIGIGTGQDLMRELTQLQISAARYANPLTLLPGNVPINEQIDLLIEQKHPFIACYCDLDHFKPFNDVYGYSKGDDIIKLTGRILQQQCDPGLDFIGHIGGDDFIVLFRSEDWEQRCRAALEAFAQTALEIYSGEDAAQGGYYCEDRQGERRFHPLISLSLGAVTVEPGHYESHHQIATAAAEAKKQAKKIAGNSLFIERRADAPAPLNGLRNEACCSESAEARPTAPA